MRILTILAKWGTEKYADAEGHVDDIFVRQLPDVDRECVVVDNALPRDAVTREGRRTLVGGDNSFWEFSAFDRGIAAVGSRIRDFDLVHLATSAFNTLYTGYLERFLPNVLAAVAGRPVCLGHLDCYNETIDLQSYRSRHWVRTSFLFLPPAELAALGSAVGVAVPERFFTGNPASPFRADAPMSATYRRLITDWLGGTDIGQGVRWHSRIAAGDDGASLFERKALAIMNEHMFSIRLRAMGCRLTDVTWLSARLREQPGEEPDWNTPWRRQLAERDRDRVIVT
jgi:hypothetical protein